MIGKEDDQQGYNDGQRADASRKIKQLPPFRRGDGGRQEADKRSSNRGTHQNQTYGGAAAFVRDAFDRKRDETWQGAAEPDSGREPNREQHGVAAGKRGAHGAHAV